MEIENEAAYDAGLLEADALMDAAAGTTDGDRLVALVAAIERYEAEHWSISSAG